MLHFLIRELKVVTKNNEINNFQTQTSNPSLSWFGWLEVPLSSVGAAGECWSHLDFSWTKFCFYLLFLQFHKKISFKSLLVIIIWNYYKQTSKTSFAQVWPTVLDDSWNHPGTVQFQSCGFSSVLIFVVVILVVFTSWLYSIGHNQLQTWSSRLYHTWNGGSSWQCGTLGPGR